MQGQNSERAGYLNAASAAVGGIADMGSTWANYKAKFPASSTASKTEYWDSALGSWVTSGKPRH